MTARQLHVQSRVVDVDLLIKPIWLASLLGDLHPKCREVWGFAVDPETITAAPSLNSLTQQTIYANPKGSYFAFSPSSTGRRLCQLDIDSLGLSIVLARFVNQTLA